MDNERDGEFAVRIRTSVGKDCMLKGLVEKNGGYSKNLGIFECMLVESWCKINPKES